MEKVRSNDGTKIAFDRLGEGHAVVLVGGAFSYRGFPKMIELAKLLAERFTVFNYDRRGRGDSGDTPPYAVEREIEDIEAIVESAGGSASLWGWSSGGVLALRAAAAGLPIDKVAVYEPPFFVNRTGHVPPAEFPARLDELTASGQRSGAAAYYMRQGMGVPRVIVALMQLTPFWSKLKATAPSLPYDWAVLGDTMSGEPLVPAEWESVRLRTLVTAGEKSPQQLREAAEALVAVLPNAEHRLLAGQSHNPSMKALAPVLLEFFDTRDDVASARSPVVVARDDIQGRAEAGPDPVT